MWLRVFVILVALGAALLPTDPRLVESLYSAGVYLMFQPTVTAMSNVAPFALGDLLIAAVVFGWMAMLVTELVRGARRGWVHAAGRILARTALWAAVLYLAFLAVWGLNYRRVPLASKLLFDEAAVNADGARRLGAEAAQTLNLLYISAHETGWSGDLGPDTPLAAAFARAAGDVGVSRPIVVGRPKQSLLDGYFHRAGVDGMTDPYFLETLVASELLPFERPFVIAHEWSHLAGFADEAEANFVGWLACLRAAEADQYSGWMFLYAEVSRGLGARDRAAVAAMLNAGPREDLRAIARRLEQQVNPRVAAVGWRVYDRYLKANRVEQGAASYAQVVRLILGARFAPAWQPQLRQPPEPLRTP
jgi:hypothetical protein